jgi:hypothetical protein
LLPLIFLFLDLALVLGNELFFADFEVAINLFDGLTVLLLNLSALLLKFLFSFSFNQWVVHFGAKCRCKCSNASSAHVSSAVVDVASAKPDACIATQCSHLLSLGILELLPVNLVKGMIVDSLPCLCVLIVDLFVLV